MVTKQAVDDRSRFARTSETRVKWTDRMRRWKGRKCPGSFWNFWYSSTTRTSSTSRGSSSAVGSWSSSRRKLLRWVSSLSYVIRPWACAARQARHFTSCAHFLRRTLPCMPRSRAGRPRLIFPGRYRNRDPSLPERTSFGQHQPRGRSQLPFLSLNKRVSSSPKYHHIQANIFTSKMVDFRSVYNTIIVSDRIDKLI